MQDSQKERWQILCEQAAVEQDPQKLLSLTREINELLKQREKRVSGTRTQPGEQASAENPTRSGQHAQRRSSDSQNK